MITKCPLCHKKTFKVGCVNGECLGYCSNCHLIVDNENIEKIGIEETRNGYIAITKDGLKILKELDKEGGNYDERGIYKGNGTYIENN